MIEVDDLDQGVALWSVALDAKEEPLSHATSQVYRRLRVPDWEVRILLQRTADLRSHKERMHLDLESDERRGRGPPSRSPRRHRLRPPAGTRLRLLGPQRPRANEFCVLQINFPHLLAQRPAWPDPVSRDT